MKVLLQRLDDGLYFEAPGRWTKNREKAKDFESGLTALSFSLSSTAKLPPVQIVLKSRDERSDIRLRCYNELEPGSPLLQVNEKRVRRLHEHVERRLLGDGAGLNNHSRPHLSSDTQTEDIKGRAA
jgi:hypothetical protein